MDATRATSAAPAPRFTRLHWVDETGSTNADLVAAARAGEPEQVLVADHQTAGRGRLGRSWEAGAGASILCSVLVRPALAIDPHLVVTSLALSAAEAIDEVAAHRLGIKWPNDLVAGTADAPDDRKVAGVLAESVADGGHPVAVVVGIGINVNWPDEMPAELAGTATSLRHLVGHEVDRRAVVQVMIDRFERHLAAPEGVRVAASARSATLGRRVRIERAAGDLVGIATGLTPEGHLLVDDGSVTHEVTVGDVVHLRPAD